MSTDPDPSTEAETPASRLTDELVVVFVRLLRREGLTVSPSEAIDALEAAKEGDVRDRTAFRGALRATLAKRAEDLDVFDRVFDELFVPETIAAVGGGDGHSHDHDSEGGYRLESPDEELVPTHEGEGHSHDPIRMLYRDEEAEVGDAFERMAAESSGDAEALPVEVTRTIADFENDPSFTDRPAPSVEAAGRIEEWKERQFEAFDAAERAEMEAVISHLVSRLRQQVKKRQNDADRGRLNVSRTLRESARTGFVPFEPVFRNTEIEKPRLVVLCDVSYSVTHTSRFMLHFLHALQNHSLIKSHNFVFVKELAEITDLAKRVGIEETIEDVFRGAVIDIDDNSDFGHAFEAFYEHHGETLRHKPTMIILGDARNNFNDTGAWVLDEIRNRSQQLVWINPEERKLWNRGPSVMGEYATHCDHVEKAATPAELEDVLEAALGRHADASGLRSNANATP
jgi:uncharacterized protein with von Willebrand factor type A (vWA) domain